MYFMHSYHQAHLALKLMSTPMLIQLCKSHKLIVLSGVEFLEQFDDNLPTFQIDAQIKDISYMNGSLTCHDL